MSVLALFAVVAAAALPPTPGQASGPGPVPGESAAPASPPGPPLVGASAAEVRSLLGEPAVAHAEGVGAMWTYRLPRCALFVYFADAGQGLRVSGAATGPRRHGETPLDAPACLAAVPPPQAPRLDASTPALVAPQAAPPPG